MDLETVKAFLEYIGEDLELDTLTEQTKGLYQVLNQENVPYSIQVQISKKKNSASLCLYTSEVFFLKELNEKVFTKKQIISNFYVNEEKRIMEQITTWNEQISPFEKMEEIIYTKKTEQTQFYLLPKEFKIQKDLKKGLAKPYIPFQKVK